MKTNPPPPPPGSWGGGGEGQWDSNWVSKIMVR